MGCCAKKKQINEDSLLKNNDKNYSITDDESIEVNAKAQSYTSMTSVKKKLSLDDFQPLKLLGTGTFGRVILVRKKDNKKLYAMKMLSKSYVKTYHQEEHTKAERDLMVSLNSPFIINIKYAFQDETNLYIITDFMQGGDMFFHLHDNDNGQFDREKAKFYIIELILALEYLHQKNMIYRDLKPENILMDKEGHIKIADFGLSKELNDINDTANTLCGTPQYLAPEVVINKEYDKGVDWWSLGCILYEFLTGQLPFNVDKMNHINQRFYKRPILFPQTMNETDVDLIRKLLTVEPKNRIGYGPNDANDIKKHPYFQDVDWEKYKRKEIKPPFIPQLDNDVDLKYFDKSFTDQPVFENHHVPRTRVQSDYVGFTFTGNSVRKDLDPLDQNHNIENNIKEEDDESLE